MAEEKLGATFSIDVTDLKAGLAQANRLIKESQSEFKAAAAGMDDWTKSQDGLTAKVKSLNDITDIQRKKVDALESEYDSLIANGLDPTSKAAVDLRTKINNEKAALAANEKELQKQQQALADLEEASDDAGDAAEDTADALKETGNAAKESGDGFTIAKGAIADLISSGLQKLVGACSNAVKSLWGLGDSTTEYRQGLNQLETAFGKVGMSAEETYQAFNYFGSVLGDTKKAQETMLMLGKIAKSEKELEKWTDTLTGVFATYGQAIPLEGLTEAINHTAQLGEVQGNLADALEWGGVSVDDFNESLAKCSDEGERAQLIQDTLNGLYGEAAETYNELNKDILDASTASTDFENAQAKLGDKIRPIQTQIKSGFAKILEAVSNLLDGVDWEGFSDKIENAFSKFIEDVLPKIIDGLEWIIDNKDVIIAGLGGIAAGFAAFKVVSIIQGVTKAMEGMTLAQAALNFVMSLNPIGLLVAAIAGLVAAFVILWNKCDGFREFWINLWEKIKEAAGAAWEWIKNAFSEVGEFFTNVFTQARDGITGVVSKWGAFFSETWEKIKSFFTSAPSWFRQKFSDAWEAIKGVFSAVGDFFGSIWDQIKAKFTDIGQKVGESVGNAFKSAINSVLATAEKVLNSPINAINKLIDDLKLPIGKLSTFNLPRMAKGGIVDSATAAIIGESGAEAVVPLENNTEWLDKLADRLVEKLGGGKGTVVVNQTNNFSQAHSRIELYKTKQQTAAAVRLAQGGAAFG